MSEPGDDRDSISYTVDGRRLSVRSPRGDEARGEADLAGRGVSVPADHRLAWASAWGAAVRPLEVWERGAPDRCLCSILVEEGETRALPGFDLWRVDRLGGFDDVDALEVALRALADSAAQRRRVLLVSVGIFGLDGEALPRLAQRAARLGFEPASQSRVYERTSRIDLGCSEDDLLAGMRPSCRRAIRAVGKNPIAMGLVEDAALAPHVEALLAETMDRTEGPFQERSWTDVIEYARLHPDSARLVGMYSTDDRVLLAFALGLRQGDHVEYRTAGSTRTGVRVPLAYALAWDLMRWGKGGGARWFDFGGLPDPGATPPELEGIVRFKESFGGEAVECREEWYFEPRPALETVRRGVSAVARMLGELSGRE